MGSSAGRCIGLHESSSKRLGVRVCSPLPLGLFAFVDGEGGKGMDSGGVKGLTCSRFKV